MMRRPAALGTPLLILCTALALGIPGFARAEANRALEVHLVQANNDSPYVFVRAKFKPGELADAWSVRFFDPSGGEIPYFVWDRVTWRVAREGRPEWGHRYALFNHAPGDAPEARQARAQKILWTKKKLPELGAELEALDQAAETAPDSVCAVLYILRHRVPPFAKERLTLRIFSKRQVEPKQQHWKGRQFGERNSVRQGPLELRDLPDRLSVAWKGRPIFHSAGFQAGDWVGTTSHADPSLPFAVEMSEGIITKVSVTAATKGRQGGSMDWQCSYWLFPEGCVVALEGFNLSETAGYAGGPQKLCIWQAEDNFTVCHPPLWETPWWLHQAGDRSFVATHLFYGTPLAIGYGNNPFTVNTEAAGKEPKAESDGKRLVLSWFHRLDDPAITRLMAPQPLRRPNDPPLAAVAKPARWQAKVDWLYRQYEMGFGENGPAAEGAIRTALGAAAGWIDRPVNQEEIATRLVQMMPRIATSRESAEIGLLKVVPAVLRGDPAAVQNALGRARDPVARTDYYINLIRRHVERGGRASEGRKKDDPDGTPREGWTGNPCYHAALMPCYVRVLEHFDLPFRQEECRQAILRFADFSLELLGGSPIDFDKLNTTFQSEWPSRIVPIIPLVLHAYTLKPQEQYARAAKIVFQDLMGLVERNPHGYFPAWTFNPKADKFDTVYNPVAYERGITSFWSEELLELIGRNTTARFVAAQARWFVFSGQLLDTLEMDNATAIRASTHGAHTNIRNQIGIYLYDDFDFYKGLLGDLVNWSAAACQMPEPADPTGTSPYRSLELSNAGSTMLRWALGIRPGGKWLESKVKRLEKGFRLQVWNRLPEAKPAVKLSARDAGLGSEGDLFQIQLSGPAFRQPAEFEVTWTADRVSLKVTKSAKIRLSYGVLYPKWAAQDRPALQRQHPAGGTEIVREDVVWENNSVTWQAVPGVYDLRIIQN